MADFRRVLDQLGIVTAPLFFVQSSSDWLGRAGIGSAEVLKALEERLDDGGAIVMPSYSFSGWHEDFLKSNPCVNLDKAPARTGMLAEMLRRRPDSVRSLDPDLPLVAWGAGAAYIAGTCPSGEDPVGRDSSFARVVEKGGYCLGLGVSYNYLALVHVFDSRFQERYPYPILSDEVHMPTVEDNRGNRYAVRRRAVLATLQRRIKPARIVGELPVGQDFFRSIAIDGTLLFAWQIKGLERWACDHIERRLATGRMPCWLDDYAEFMSRPLGDKE